MRKWKFNIWLIIIICAFVIGYPFFTIKYFESFTALKFTLKYILPIILIILLIVFPKFYFKKIKPYNPKPINKTKDKLKDIFSIMFMILCSSLLFIGISFSTIITTNKFFGKSEIVKINQPVLKYSPEITKNGRLRHHISFKNPKTNEIISLEVYREYKVGEIFIKEMEYGAWEILYSTE